MKRVLSGVVAALAVVVSVVCAWGEGSPVVLTHTLTGYYKAEKTVTLEYAVQVQSRENASLGALSLALVPHPPFVTSKATVSVDGLAPKAAATVNVKLVTPRLLDRNYFEKMPLLWAGRLTDAGGKVVEFPVKSRPGGGK